MGSRECYLSLQPGHCHCTVISSRVVALQIPMQLSSPGPAAAGRLHPPLHLRGDESRGVAGNVFREMDRPELAATRPLEIIINLNRFCDQDTKCLGVAIRIIACDGHG